MLKRVIVVLLTLLLSLSAFLEALPFAGFAAASPTWTNGGPIEKSTGTNQYPAALQASDGTIWLAWSLHSPLGSQDKIYYKTMIRTGGVWVNTTRTPISTNTKEITPSLGQLDLDTIILVWASNQTRYYHLVYEEYFLNNRTWSPSFNITTGLASDTSPSVAVTRSGTLWLFWNRQMMNDTQIYYETMTNGAWSGVEKKLTSGPNVNLQPAATIGRDGRVMLTYASGTGGVYQIMYNSYGPAGWGLTPIQVTPIPSNGGQDKHPAIVQDRNGTSWIFWQRLTFVTSLTFTVKIFGKSDANYGQNWPSDPETQLTFDHDNQLFTDQLPVAIQSARDKSVWVVYSTNTANRGEFDLYLVAAKIAPVHDLRVLGLSISPSQCLVGITYVCFSTNPLEIYAGGFTNNYAVCPGPPIFNCPVVQSPNVTLTILLWNLGDYNETVSMTVRTAGAASLSVSIQTLTVYAGNQSSPVVNWNTASAGGGHYGFFVNASIANQLAINKPDNLLTTTNQVRLLPLGDVDQDGSVTLTDFSVIVYDYGFSCFTTASCSPRYIAAQYGDVHGAGVIDIVDAGVVLQNYGIST